MITHMRTNGFLSYFLAAFYAFFFDHSSSGVVNFHVSQQIMFVHSLVANFAFDDYSAVSVLGFMQHFRVSLEITTDDVFAANFTFNHPMFVVNPCMIRDVILQHFLAAFVALDRRSDGIVSPHMTAHVRFQDHDSALFACVRWRAIVVGF